MTNKRTVLHVLGELRPSGAETMLRSAAKYWKSQGCELHILSTGDTVGTYASRLADAGYKIHHIQFSKSPRFFIKFWHLLREKSWDVVHLHTERANFYLGMLTVFSGAKKIIRTIHSCFEFTGHLHYRQCIQRKVLQTIGVRHVAISQEVKKIEETRYGLRCFTIANWFDSEYFRPPTQNERKESRKTLGIEDDRKVCILVGNCSDIKNHRLVLRALGSITKKIDWHLLHIGIEERDCPERKLANNLGIANRITFMGGQADVRRYLWASDLFLMPSKHEGFGIATLEALACGTNVAVADVPGLSFFALCFDGLALVLQNENSWVNVIESKLTMDQSLRSGISNEWSQKARELFPIERGAGIYLQLYEKDAEDRL